VTTDEAMHFAKAHAYGNDFLYARTDAAAGAALDVLARDMCDRHTGVGADGLIVYEPTPGGAAMRLFNADGSRAEVSGNGVRGLGALLLRGHGAGAAELTIQTEAGPKKLIRTGEEDGRQMFRAEMGLPSDIRRPEVTAGGEPVQLVVMNFGNPQCVVLGPLPDEAGFRRIGAALERHALFPEGTNVEFAHVEADIVRILIWERGVGPTLSSGTGSCAAAVAAASFAGGARDVTVIAPGGRQRVEWRADSVYLTGWAEVVCEGEWLRPLR
jgi:diaminopimelate epimerase